LSPTGEIHRLLNGHHALFFKDVELHQQMTFPNPRTHSAGHCPTLATNLATTNEGPNTQSVHPQNEFTPGPHFQIHVLFHCLPTAMRE
ncbi:hypothetical protein BS50DRAFT_489127, partial [Corynespora cassiicola Philippines]